MRTFCLRALALASLLATLLVAPSAGQVTPPGCGFDVQLLPQAVARRPLEIQVSGRWPVLARPVIGSVSQSGQDIRLDLLGPRGGPSVVTSFEATAPLQLTNVGPHRVLIQLILDQGLGSELILQCPPLDLLVATPVPTSGTVAKLAFITALMAIGWFCIRAAGAEA